MTDKRLGTDQIKGLTLIQPPKWYLQVKDLEQQHDILMLRKIEDTQQKLITHAADDKQQMELLRQEFISFKIEIGHKIDAMSTAFAFSDGQLKRLIDDAAALLRLSKAGTEAWSFVTAVRTSFLWLAPFVAAVVTVASLYLWYIGALEFPRILKMPSP